MPSTVLRKAEADVENRVCKWAVEQGIMTFKFTPAGRRGWPDRMFLCEGRVAFIEFKAERERPKGLQLHCIELLNDAKVPAIYTSRYDEAINFLCKHFGPIGISKTPLDSCSLKGLPDYSSTPV